MSLASTFKQLGWSTGSLYIAGRLLEVASAKRCRIVRYRLVAQPIGQAGVKPLRPDAATALVAVRQGDPLVQVFPRPAGILARRYAAGAACTTALVRGQFAGFIWIQRERYEEDEVRCSFVLADPASSVWDFDVYVEPAYRVGRTMARLWSHVDAELAATGVRWSFSRISAFNAASLASHARLGTVTCARATFVLLGPLQISFVPDFPYLHVSANARRVPRVTLRPPE